jgi:hypothetical protein
VKPDFTSTQIPTLSFCISGFANFFIERADIEDRIREPAVRYHLPPNQNSVGACTYWVAKRFAKSAKVLVYGIQDTNPDRDQPFWHCARNRNQWNNGICRRKKQRGRTVECAALTA